MKHPTHYVSTFIIQQSNSDLAQIVLPLQQRAVPIIKIVRLSYPALQSDVESLARPGSFRTAVGSPPSRYSITATSDPVHCIKESSLGNAVYLNLKPVIFVRIHTRHGFHTPSSEAASLIIMLLGRPARARFR